MSNKNSNEQSGPNAWLIEELYNDYLGNPASVTSEWQSAFSGQPVSTPPSTGDKEIEIIEETPSSGAEPKKAEIAEKTGNKDTATEEVGEPLKGVSALIAKNMEASLEVPTATSFREIPAKLLEINRKVLNNHLQRINGGKTSFTHYIGYAIVRAIADEVPSLNYTYATDSQDKPRLLRNVDINLGIAVDQQKPDGSRSLIVPVIKKCQDMNFAEFVAAYEAVIKKVRSGKIGVDDLTGATVTLTNPGTIGTVQSVPRLMPGQGAIIGAGRIGYPAEYQATDPQTLADLGISKVVTITSTYDHRIIQGAESGFFLKKIHELLIGEEAFYSNAFADMSIPYEAVQWREDSTHEGESHSHEAANVKKQIAVNTLINQYRVRGHLLATTNPLADSATETHPELDPATFGLTIWDLDREFTSGSDAIYAPAGGKTQDMKLGDILGVLRDAYCRTIGVEYMHISNPDEKRWFQQKLEVKKEPLSEDQQRHIHGRLVAAETFEKFLATKYVGQKRFGLEGTESIIPILDEVFNAAAESAMDKIVVGMAHRGRLNVLINIMGKDPVQLFSEFDGNVAEDDVQGAGDVKYHLGIKGTHTTPNGKTISTELAANPSHLESVDPVVVGMARAYMDNSDTGNYPILPILIHGDAAFAGQGVVTETLNLSQVNGYRIGGTVHLVVNNQLGYTTAPHQSRSFDYSTDIAKAVQAPIFHVNADDPEACVRVAQLAFEYRQQFNKDVVIDMIGYRRHGHNEGDDPSYTQPMMYSKIAKRPSVKEQYTNKLVSSQVLTPEEGENATSAFSKSLQTALDRSREEAPPKGIKAKPSPPPKGVLPHVNTGVDKKVLDSVYSALSKFPEDFTVHPGLQKQFKARDEMYKDGQVDWALGEAFAIGTLLAEGYSVRLAGQDSRRGTFAHRHATLHDYENGSEYTPLAELESDDNHFYVYDSTLSEYAGLGFEYGYAVADPESLVMWEAQFGDFVNGAQIILDQYLVAAEDKWKQVVDLTLLLPHGYEGQGPEHSSARLERFLNLAAEDNIQIVNVTTAAQFFHVLRRQKINPNSKPLIVMTPKSGLRAKYARSPISDFTEGSFQEVLHDTVEDPAAVKRVIFASGKMAAEAIRHREETGDFSRAVVRVEQLYPWPFAEVAKSLATFGNAKEVVWLQEEPENMGAWNAIKGRLYEKHESTHRIIRVSRSEAGSPATGSAAIHKQEQAELLEKAFGKL